MKPRVIFVGSFRDETGDGGAGGQLAACRSILASPLSSHVDWVLVDSTMESVPPPSLARRCLKAVARLCRFGRELAGGADAVLIFTSRGAGLIEKSVMALAAAGFRKRLVLSPRSGLIAADMERSLAWRMWIRFVLKRCDVILCQGEVWKSLYQDLTGLPDHRFAVVPNLLAAQPFLSLGDGRGRDGARTSFLYLGWLETHKGIFDLIEAVGSSRASLAGARVVVCGRGSKADAAQARVAALGLADMFEFRGWVSGERKMAALGETDVLVIPSHAEGLPNALLEGMAAGLGVVGTRVGAIPETLEGGAGILIEPRDVEALSATLVRLAAEPELRRSLGTAARRRIEERHDAARAWPRLLEVLEGSGP